MDIKKIYNATVIALCFVGITMMIVALEFVYNRKGFDSFMGELHGIFLIIMWFLAIMFALGIVMVVTTWLMWLRRENKIIRPSKHGPAQVLIHRGEVVLLNPPVEQLDPARQMAMVKQVMQLSSVLARSAKQEPDTNEYEALPEPKTQPIAVSAEDHLNFSPTFQPHADDILSGRGSIFGVSGAGKSNSVADLIEELGRLRVPMILADTEDEYQSLSDPRWLPMGRIAGATGTSQLVVPALTEDAKSFGRYLLDNRLQVILNLASYDSDDQAALVMINIIAGMKEWEEERAPENRMSCMFILEEASVWLPQNLQESRLSKDMLAMMHSAFFADLVRRGRKRGMGFTLATQRIAEIDKRALQSSWKILHRQTEDTDLKRYELMGLKRDDVIALQNGEAFVYTSRVSGAKVQMRRRYSEHGANTPGLESIRKPQNVGRNASEIVPNFGENRENFGFNRNDFDTPTEPFRNISDFRKTGQISPKNPYEGIPENLIPKIEDLYQEYGRKNRTAIRDRLNLNGDEYWMIRVVCDEYDRKVAQEA